MHFVIIDVPFADTLLIIVCGILTVEWVMRGKQMNKQIILYTLPSTSLPTISFIIQISSTSNTLQSHSKTAMAKRMALSPNQGQVGA